LFYVMFLDVSVHPPMLVSYTILKHLFVFLPMRWKWRNFQL